jgi:hypothetical protein
MTLDKKVSDLLTTQIPDYVQEFYPLFVIFVTKYFEWLEQPGNPQEIIQNIQLNFDIDTTASSLATKFMSIYAPSFPQISALDRTILIKNFRQFYRSKGSEESFRYFFRAFFDDEISIKLPGDQLFATSDAEWYIEKKLRVQAVSGDPRKLATVQIVGTSSNATAVVEEAVQTYGAWDLRLENRSLAGTFNSSETIIGTYYNHAENTSSEITVLNLEPLQTLPGRQRGTASLLSADRVLQDSVFWQKFSYVVRTKVNLDRWRDAILEQLHPTGRNIFGELLLDNNTSIAVSSTTQFVQTNAIESEVRLFTTSASFYLQPGFTWDRIADFRTGTSATNLVTAGTTVVSYDAGFSYAGENITFALQSAVDNSTIYQETFNYTSITGTININVTTGQTATYRDRVRYSAPVTSITGTISAVQQVGGDEITFTGTGTLFSSELFPSTQQLWWRDIGRDAAQNVVYEFYPAVLTIRQLPITGTLTIAAQTPVAPDYLIYVSGVNTKFRSDLLITGLDTSTGILNETTRPVVEDGQIEPRIFLDNWPLSGDITFTSGSTSVVGVGTAFLSEVDTLSTATLTVTKPLFGRFTQVSSIPTTTAFYEATTSQQLTQTTISGTTLTYALTTSNYSSISTFSWGTDRSTRYDIPTPFPIQFIDTSTTKLYVHASGFIAADTSTPSVRGTSASFRPFGNKRFVGVFPSQNNNLHSVHYGTQGSTPNRYFTIHYNGDYGRASTGTLIDFLQNYSSYQTAMTTRGGAPLANMSTTPTSGTATNGYYAFNLPWSVWVAGSSQTRVFFAHTGIMSFGNWIDAFGSSITDRATVRIGLAPPRLNQIWFGSYDPYYRDATDSYLIPNQVNRTYSHTLGTAPNRSYVIRFEGDWNSSATVAAGSSRFIVEVEFKENDLSSVLVHYGHPAVNPAGTYDFVLSQVSTFTTNFLEEIDGTPSTGLNFNSHITYAYSTHNGYSGIYVPVTSGLVEYYASFYGTLNAAAINPYFYDYYNFRTQQKWEMSFPENSASPVILRTGLISNNSGTDNQQGYYNYLKSTGTIYYNNPWEWSEGTQGGGVASSMVTEVFSNQYFVDSSTTTVFFTRYGSSEALTTVIPSTETTSLLLLRSWNATSAANPEIIASTNQVSTRLETNYNSILDAQNFWSGNGVIYRYPRDGYNATASNLDPNPTMGTSSVAAQIGSTIPNTSYGILFSFGSSALVHSRFVQTTPLYGVTHTLTVSGNAGNNTTSISNNKYNSLGYVLSGQDLEAWYSTDPTTQPPTAGQSPSVLGWTRAGTIATNLATRSTGGAFNNISFTATSPTGILSWLIWQKSFSTQTTADQRLSEYLIRNIVVTATPSSSEQRANTRLVLGSGSVVRITTPTNKEGTAFAIERYYVAEDPRRRRIAGDQYLILRPVDTVTSMPYLSSINSWSTGGTTSYAVNNVALNNIQVSFQEARTIASITTQTALTVSAAWTSTSNRAWGGGGGSSISKRVFAIDTVVTDTSMTLRNIAGSVTQFNPPITSSISTTSVADRRFSIVNVNSNTDIQASGGGIYANIVGKLATFAIPRPVTIDGQTGYVLQGDVDNIVNTSLNTRWQSDGLPGTDDRGDAYGVQLEDLTATIYGYTGALNPDGTSALATSTGTSFTVLRIFGDSSILITGNTLNLNFFNHAMISRFPANSSEITVTGTGTLFVITSITVSSATQTFEQVTEFDFNDRRTGYMFVSGQLIRVIDILNNTSLLVSSLAIRKPIVAAVANSFRRTRGFAPPRALGRPGSATFDKSGARVVNDETLIVEDSNIDYTKIQELYHNSSNLTLSTSTVLLSTSVTVTSGSSILLMVTWTKDLAGNTEEALNQLRVTVSSAGTFVAKFNDEIQRNHKDIAVAQTQLYRDSVYLTSSNSISSVTGVVHGDTVSSITWIWSPYIVNRSGTYSRLSAVLDSSTVTSISITVETGVTETWQSLATDFLNITVIGTA